MKLPTGGVSGHLADDQVEDIPGDGVVDYEMHGYAYTVCGTASGASLCARLCDPKRHHCQVLA
jgi:hypothetical protein